MVLYATLFFENCCLDTWTFTQKSSKTHRFNFLIYNKSPSLNCCYHVIILVLSPHTCYHQRLIFILCYNLLLHNSFLTNHLMYHKYLFLKCLMPMGLLLQKKEEMNLYHSYDSKTHCGFHVWQFLAPNVVTGITEQQRKRYKNPPQPEISHEF